LEEAKLQRMPKPKRFHGRIALVTGAAGGIGGAICDQILADGGCVVLTDIAADRLARVEAEFAAQYGADFVTRFVMDVTDENAVAGAMRHATLTFGGLDFLVANAGIAGGAPLTETTVADWDKNMDILGKGYFLSAREAFRLFEAQQIGGSIVFIGSKNGLAASAGAAAYCSAKAAEIHLARCLALEGAAKGIRVNTVNPDAVIEGSQIWSGAWKEARAKA
jgi:NAD(P)-dependent dehydrogenase (short-subunit alcohol dehydrogenase family)